jgi:hypothetical protein
MTTYSAITTGELDQDSPVTQPLVTKLRDNPIAIAEADSSVASTLFPTVLLGSIATTSGTSQSLSSLDLTPFRAVKLYFDAVTNSASTTFQITGIGSIYGSVASIRGMLEFELANGQGFSVLANSYTAGAGQASAINSTITNASTSITITTSVGSFTAGAVHVYGVK